MHLKAKLYHSKGEHFQTSPSDSSNHRQLALQFISFGQVNTGRERLIRSHSSARFCFELSGNSN